MIVSTSLGKGSKKDVGAVPYILNSDVSSDMLLSSNKKNYKQLVATELVQLIVQMKSIDSLVQAIRQRLAVFYKGNSTDTLTASLKQWQIDNKGRL